MTHNIPRIKELPAATSALIAAGEIIHGPSDVLKELLENALDAGATKIVVELSQGGIEKILVRDNGCGILSDDLKYAPKRYTTSKLSHVDELKSLMTYGFRGEALFSISSVSNFTLRSRPQEQEFGYQLRLWSPLREWEQQKCAMASGTEVLCEHLFAPLPVRRQFLKSPRLEARRCFQTVTNILLMHPHCSVSCSDHGMTQINWPSSDNLVQRFSKVFNAPVLNWIFVEHACDRGVIKIWYYPDSTKALEQYWYCHRRWFADKSLMRLAQQFFEEGILVIDLEIHRASIDVNFHPQKHEIDFMRKEGLIASLTDIFHRVRPKKNSFIQEKVPLELPASGLTYSPMPLIELRDVQKIPKLEITRQIQHKAASVGQDKSGSNLSNAMFLQQISKPSMPEHKSTSAWFFISRVLAFYDRGSDIIVFNPEKLGRYVSQQQILQDLILPINVQPELADYLRSWSCRCHNNQIEAIPRLWDRFWMTAIAADFRESAPWYRRFYQGLIPVWEKIADKQDIEVVITKSHSLINFMSYEEFGERLNG